jgi:hypothetical protein
LTGPRQNANDPDHATKISSPAALGGNQGGALGDILGGLLGGRK